MSVARPQIILDRSFRFAAPATQALFLRLLRKAGAPYYIDRTKTAFYSSVDEDVIENELIQRVRDALFPKWSVLHCPPDWVERYRAYMARRSIPYHEELTDGEIAFLIPGRYNPHSWTKV